MNFLRAVARRTPKLRTVMVLLILATVVPCALVSFGLLWFGYERAVADTNANALAEARSASVRLDQRFQELRHALEALAASRDLDDNDLESFRQQAARFIATDGIATNVTLVSRDGLQIMNTSRPAGSEPIAAQPQLVALFSRGDFAVTSLVEGRILGQVIVVGVPARRGDKILFVVGAALKPELMRQVIETVPSPASWTISVLDPTGRIVVRRPHRDEYVGQPANPDLFLAVNTSDEGLLRAKTKEGTPVFAAFSRSQGSKYAVAIGAPEEELLAPVRGVAAVVAGIILAVVGASLVLALLIARQVTSGIGVLSDVAHEFGRQAVPSGRLAFREAERLRVGFNIGAAELEQATAEIRALRQVLHEGAVKGLEEILDASWEPVVLANEDANVIAANDAAIALFRPSTRLEGASLRDLFHPEGHDAQATTSVMRGHAVAGDGAAVPCTMRSAIVTINGVRFLCAGFLPDAGVIRTSTHRVEPAMEPASCSGSLPQSS